MYQSGKLYEWVGLRQYLFRCASCCIKRANRTSAAKAAPDLPDLIVFPIVKRLKAH